MATIDWSKHSLLIVDFDLMFLEMASKAFRHAGVGDVRVAPSSLGAIKTMEAYLPTALIVELRMPDLNGPDFARRVRSGAAGVPPNMPVLMTVSKASPELLREACSVGIEGMIKKPLKADALVRQAGKFIFDGEPYSGPRRPAAAAPPAGPGPPSASPRLLPRANPDADLGPRTDLPPAPRPPQPGPPSPAALPPAPTPPPAEPAQPKLRFREGTDTSVAGALRSHQLWIDTGGKEGALLIAPGADLRGADLKDAEMPGMSLARADLSGADCRDAFFRRSDLNMVKFVETNLEYTDLAMCRLRQANFKRARMAGTNLRGADLTAARFTGARLAGAVFDGCKMLGTDVRGCDLRHVKGLKQIQVNRLNIDADTQLPHGLKPPHKRDANSAATKPPPP